MLKSICICKRGNVREVNQDRAGAFSMEDRGLYLVSDGMGGHYAGERASGAIYDACSGWWKDYCAAPQRPNFSRSISQIQTLIQTCSAQIHAGTPAGEICGATLVLLLLVGPEYALLSVGDSRCYQVLRKGLFVRSIQLTADDVMRGSKNQRQNGKLLRAVGAKEGCEISLQTGRAAAGVVFALCSDGVYKFCPPAAWKRAMHSAATGHLQDAGVLVSQAILDQGAPDNYSPVLVRA